jgi:fido (protein-threonine AMPylation protein)
MAKVGPKAGGNDPKKRSKSLHTRGIENPSKADPVDTSKVPGPAAEDMDFGTSQELKALRERYRTHLVGITGDPMKPGVFDFSEVYPDTSKIKVLLEQVDDLKKCLDSFRPLNPSQAANLQGAFDIEYTYDSNRIEGNTLTLMETHLVINKGLTIGGKRLEEHLEAINHKEAIDFIRDLVSKNEELTEYNLKSIHALILRGIDSNNAGTYRQVPVYISGSTFVPPQPYLVPKMMEDYFLFYGDKKNEIHPVLLASEMHGRLVTIHPFIDGNGRTSRLVMNLTLLRNGYPIANISGDARERENYYNALQTKQTGGSLDDFHRVILRSVKDGFFRYLSAVAGGVGKEEEAKGSFFFERVKPFLDSK